MQVSIRGFIGSVPSLVSDALGGMSTDVSGIDSGTIRDRGLTRFVSGVETEDLTEGKLDATMELPRLVTEQESETAVEEESRVDDEPAAMPMPMGETVPEPSSADMRVTDGTVGVTAKVTPDDSSDGFKGAHFGSGALKPNGVVGKMPVGRHMSVKRKEIRDMVPCV